jgi:hypothetical protein
MYTIDEETIFTTEINLPENMNFSDTLEHVKEFILKEGHDFNNIKGLSILVRK